MYGSLTVDYLRPPSPKFHDEISRDCSLENSWEETVSTQTVESSTTRNISPAVGYLYSLNYLIGNGFLVLPFAFYYAGLVFSCFTLLAISSVCCLTVFWTLDVMARAQAIEYFKETGARFDIASYSSRQSNPHIQDCHSNRNRRPLPTYEVQSDRKFEMAELCELILGSSAKYIYVISIFIYLIVTCWAYATIAGVTWSATIAWAPTGPLEGCKCGASDFTDVYIPNNLKCREAYWFYLALFALIAVPLSCLDFREQRFIQVSAALFRILCVSLMTGQSIYDITKGIASSTPSSTVSNSSSFTADLVLNKTHHHHGYKVTPFDVNVLHWLWAVPVMIHSQVLHQSVPSLSYRVREPWRYLSRIYVATFMSSCIINIVYSSSVAGRYQEEIMENSALNWAEQKYSDILTRRILAYLVSFLPSLDVLSLFPMVIVTLADNIFFVFYGRDTSLSAQHLDNYRRKKTTLRVILALIPMFCALFIANLFYITKYAGVSAILIVFVFPALLQYKSRVLCRKMFGTTKWEHRGTETADGPMFEKDELSFINSKQRSQTFRMRLNDNDEIKTPYSTFCSGRLSNFLAIILAIAVACFTAAAFILNETDSKARPLT